MAKETIVVEKGGPLNLTVKQVNTIGIIAFCFFIFVIALGAARNIDRTIPVFPYIYVSIFAAAFLSLVIWAFLRPDNPAWRKTELKKG